MICILPQIFYAGKFEVSVNEGKRGDNDPSILLADRLQSVLQPLSESVFPSRFNRGHGAPRNQRWQIFEHENIL